MTEPLRHPSKGVFGCHFPFEVILPAFTFSCSLRQLVPQFPPDTAQKGLQGGFAGLGKDASMWGQESRYLGDPHDGWGPGWVSSDIALGACVQGDDRLETWGCPLCSPIPVRLAQTCFELCWDLGWRC